MIRYLLDTNVCIEIIRARSPVVMERLRACALGEAAVSSITLAELQYGVAKSSNQQRNATALVTFCAPLAIKAFDDRAASHYGRIRSELETAGTPIGPLDTLIAAHALALGVVLVTNNLREFSRVQGLVVEDWTS